MWRYIFHRMLLLIPTLLGILAITFAVIQFVPGGADGSAADAGCGWR